MVLFAFLLIAFFAVTAGIAYLVLYFPIKWIFEGRARRIARLLFPFLFGLLTFAYYLFTSPVYNNKVATIEEVGGKYEIIVTGERMLMVHDPISLLQRKTYLDSMRFVIPRSQGIINAREIPADSFYDKLSGKMTLNDDDLLIELYYKDFDDKTNKSLIWNGKYKILRIQ
ncbi:hypothetical protein [Hufsiella ginkgonis]|uniref:Uncharacterized protein n=1 Tax=Hufsiella ginkgonis TaxID=2695274 RepID=A0A7K1XTI2_9SPHI|nr:hypothetical protein [Hufsiella ginkgonis]MXV14321.1 hypothetical protein [Hufsiella ginkgonis]